MQLYYIENVDIKLSAHFWEKARSNKVTGPNQDICNWLGSPMHESGEPNLSLIHDNFT